MEPVSAQGYCRKCDYPLDGVAAAKCPECGRAFDPTDAATVSARPTARRRRWVRRLLMLAGVFVLWCVFGPSRVARFTWTWPSEDGKSATSETRWHVLGPRWLGMTYAKVSSRRWKHPMPSGYLTVADYRIWGVGVVSARLIEGASADRPPLDVPHNFGALIVFSTLKDSKGAENRTVDIRTGNFDELAELLMAEDHRPWGLSWSPHVLKAYPPEAREK